MTQLASQMVMYRAMQAEPVERPAENPIGKMWKKLKDTLRKEGTEESLPPLENGPYIKWETKWAANAFRKEKIGI